MERKETQYMESLLVGVNPSEGTGHPYELDYGVLVVQENVMIGEVPMDPSTAHGQYALNVTDGKDTYLGGNLTVAGTMTQGTITGGIVPTHGIIMWSGAVNNIPTGWALCNGTNGTPNLSGQFIVAAGDKYEVGNTGGTDRVTLNIAQMPRHNHGGGKHNHQIIIGDDRHRYGNDNVAYNGAKLDSNTGGNVWTKHALDIIEHEGQGDSHENRPSYYALAFIMKL